MIIRVGELALHCFFIGNSGERTDIWKCELHVLNTKAVVTTGPELYRTARRACVLFTRNYLLAYQHAASGLAEELKVCCASHTAARVLGSRFADAPSKVDTRYAPSLATDPTPVSPDSIEENDCD